MNATTPSGETRMVVARNALREILDSLAQRRGHPYQVSVIAYAHRRGWKLNDAKTDYEVIQWNDAVIKNKALPRDRDRDTIAVGPPTPQNTPALDWEVIWPTQTLTESSVRDLKEKLNRLQPVGRDPAVCFDPRGRGAAAPRLDAREADHRHHRRHRRAKRRRPGTLVDDVLVGRGRRPAAKFRHRTGRLGASILPPPCWRPRPKSVPGAMPASNGTLRRSLPRTTKT